MSRRAALFLALVLAGTIPAAVTFAQVPGAAGAGPSAISGVPNGPANPSALSDPSGIGNASRMPTLGSNAPAPPTSYGALPTQPIPSSRSRVVTPSYTSGGSRYSARNIEPRRPSNHRRMRPQTSTFTGICRGC